MSEFSIPVRKYSFYTIHEPAPSGFDTAGRSTQIDKWQHLSSDGRINLTLKNEGEKVLQLSVCNTITKEEYEHINLAQIRFIFSFLKQDPVQFSVKAPSVSCKYLFLKDNQIWVKRFQLGFYNGIDFIQTSDLLQKLGFVVKQAISTRNSTIVAQSQNYIYGQPRTFSTAFVEPSTTSTNNVLKPRSTTCAQWPATANQFIFDQGLDFALSQSTPIHVPKANIVDYVSRNAITQSVMNVVERNDEISQNETLKTVVEAPVLEKNKVDLKNVQETVESPTMEFNDLKFPIITQEYIRSKLENAEFMKWVSITLKH